VNDETYPTGRRTRKGQAVRCPSLKRRPQRTGLNEHATQRAEGWQHIAAGYPPAYPLRVNRAAQ